MKWQPADDETIKRLRGEGYSANRIAIALNSGFSRNAVIGRMHRLGLTNADTPHTPKVVKLKVISEKPVSQRRPLPPLSVIAMRCSEIVPRNIPLIDLEHSDCRYPYGDQDITFCGHPKLDDQPYCGSHFDLCRQQWRT